MVHSSSNATGYAYSAINCKLDLDFLLEKLLFLSYELLSGVDYFLVYRF